MIEWIKDLILIYRFVKELSKDMPKIIAFAKKIMGKIQASSFGDRILAILYDLADHDNTFYATEIQRRKF